MQDLDNMQEQIVANLTLYINEILIIEKQQPINYDEIFIICSKAYLYILGNSELNSLFNELKNKGLKLIESKKYKKLVSEIIINNKHFFPQISEEYINEQFRTNPILIKNLTIILKAIGIETTPEDYNYKNLLIFIQDRNNYCYFDVEKLGMIFYALLDILKSFSYGYLSVSPELFKEITPRTVEFWDDLTNRMVKIINTETIHNKVYLWNTQYKNRLLPSLSEYQKEEAAKTFVYILEYLRNYYGKETIEVDYKKSKTTPRAKKVARLEYLKTTDEVRLNSRKIYFTDSEKQFCRELLTNIENMNKRAYKDFASNIKKKINLEFLKPNRKGKFIIDEDAIEIIGFENYSA